MEVIKAILSESEAIKKMILSADPQNDVFGIFIIPIFCFKVSDKFLLKTVYTIKAISDQKLNSFQSNFKFSNDKTFSAELHIVFIQKWASTGLFFLIFVLSIQLTVDNVQYKFCQ